MTTMSLQEGYSVGIPFSVDAAKMALFARLSGDENPLHTDEAFAISRGFRGRVVYGALIVAQISALLGERLPGRGCVWQSLKLGFREPLYVDEPAVLVGTLVQVSAALSVYRVAIRVTAGDRTIALGEAQTIRKDM